LNHRLFIAIEVPPAEIIPLQSDLDRLGLPVVWEKPGKLHITLNFLGATPDTQISQIKSVISKTAESFPQFTLQPFFLETLYRRHDPSLIYLGLTGDVDNLKQLQKSLAQSLSMLSLPSQERFFPHVTIGKVKRDDPIQTKKFLANVADYNFTPLRPFAVNSLILYESFLSKSGSTFQKIARYMLQSPPT